MCAPFPADDGRPWWGAYLIRRFFLMLLTLFGISVIIFVMLRVVPGNIADILFDAAGFDRPGREGQDRRPSSGSTSRSPVQYAHWIGGLLHGDLGYSYVSEKPALDGDPAAHSDHRASSPAWRCCSAIAVRRAARRDQRGQAEHRPRLCVAGDQPERAVDAGVLARAADPDGVRALFRHDPDLHRRAEELLGRAASCTACRRPRSASAARR